MELAPTLDPIQAAAVWRRAEGSPFWLHQLAAHQHPEADAAALIAGRLERIGPDAAALLSALALAARPLTPEDAVAIQQWPAHRVAAAAADLVAEGLVVDAAGSLRAAHDLIRESAAASIPPEVARRLHRRLAAWLEELAGDDQRLLLEALEHRTSGAMPAVDLALRLARSPRRRLTGVDGLRRLASIADRADGSDPAAGELQRHVAALAAELGDHELALARWSSLASRPGQHAEIARAALAASESALQLGRARGDAAVAGSRSGARDGRPCPPDRGRRPGGGPVPLPGASSRGVEGGRPSGGGRRSGHRRPGRRDRRHDRSGPAGLRPGHARRGCI
jgi:hypothetical protein